jgi:molybdopterin molybdotransferase
MIEVEAAQQRILSLVNPLPGEVVALDGAVGRILAEEAVAPIDLPVFDNSAMDGYAVRTDDLAKADRDHPVTLRVLGKVAAGGISDVEVIPGTCVRLFTGSPLPAGADAVVMQEEVKVSVAQHDHVLFVENAKAWENVRFRGEDLKRGSLVARSGECLTVGRIAVLAALGWKEINVGRQPVVGLMATGSELQQAGLPLGPGQIYESNCASLSALVTLAGGKAKSSPLVKDDLEATELCLAEALAECDVVITSGGVSVGDFDFVKAALERLGGELIFWKVAVKPGRPFVLGQCKKKLVFGLPGNPVSALVTFLLLVRPALLRLQGAASPFLTAYPGVLAEAFVNRGERRHFMRVKIDGAGNVRSAGTQASHILSSLAEANGLVDVPPGKTLPMGETVSVLRWE